VAALALLAQPTASTAARLVAGRYGDRFGQTRFVVPGLLATAAGMAALCLTSQPAAVVGGALVFGAGFGVIQNVSLTLMYGAVPASEYGTVSALWNLAYDAGWGLGAAGFGFLAPLTGYSPAFALTAAVVLVALLPARLLRTR
jgi:predicted MFS family arabinose efflux permease